ncbi:MAG: 2-oxo acid dehydrogenase subunit E2 [Verrucomicrobiaceae bacterium]|nr:2-oxo acid dehydrogenase subunit E2 [Verrucomicrobiaceae bacterium]
MPQIPITMPQLGESIAEAIVVDIQVQPGDTVAADQEIMEVETNKAVMSVTTPSDGVIDRVTAEKDVSYAVGATLGYLTVSTDAANQLGLSDPGDSRVSAESDDTAGVHFKVEDDAVPQIDAEQLQQEDDQPTVKPTIEGLPVPAKATGASYLSPRLKARMVELGLNKSDLAGVAGSGSGGRVTVEDFDSFVAEIEQNKMTPASPMRIAVADSMRRSWSRPLATVGSPIVLDALLDHRRTAQQKAGPALYLIRALALALAENTAVAGRLVGSQIVHPGSVDIGFAVEAEDGVLVPVIRDVDQKPLSQLVPIYDRLVGQARDRRLPPDALGTGIATVTNFGTFGIVWATPIPLPEQNLVLGLGRGSKQPVWDDEKNTFVPVTGAALTLSFDHRVLDGGAAGRLLSRISELLQKPEDL